MKWENAQRTYLGKIFSQYSLQLNLRLMKILEFRPWPGHGNNEFDEIDNAKTVHLQFLWFQQNVNVKTSKGKWNLSI